MNTETRTVVYDEDLKIEAYQFKGIMQPFPKHFHEYYVIGFIEQGKRYISCATNEYTASSGDILIFNPGDNHSCTQCDNGTLNYRAINISKDTMQQSVFEITGENKPLRFKETVITDYEISSILKKLHQMIMDGVREFEKEELLLFMLSQLIYEYGEPFETAMPECGTEIEAACKYMNEHYSEHITLKKLCTLTSLSKATLIRSFTKIKGISPYRYLENVRLGVAKKLLEQGVLPIDAAMQTGFSDQSHFTNFFKDYIGLTPRHYRDIFK